MIDAIKFGTTQNQAGKVFDQVTVWIGGIPFRSDLTPQVESIAMRIAGKAGLELQDRRAEKGINT